MYKILIAEDDAALAAAMKKHIGSWDYSVRCVRNFENIIPEFTEFDPHIVLLDIMLPFYNGYHWCTQLRRISNVPIVFISSASDNMNIVMAMNMGGDDFIAKPFEPNVLVAKIQAILRRTYDMTDKIPVLEHKGAVGRVVYGRKRRICSDNGRIGFGKDHAAQHSCRTRQADKRRGSA